MLNLLNKLGIPTAHRKMGEDITYPENRDKMGQSGLQATMKGRKMNKAQKAYVILTDPVCSSCMVNAVYLDKERAEKWIKKENKRAGYNLYWVEQSQLIK